MLKLENKINEIFEYCNESPLEYFDLKEIVKLNLEDSFYDSFYEITDGFNQEVIYYYNAMKYLTENDASLQDSLELAIEYGFELKNINSELLASLLSTKDEQERQAESCQELKEYIDSLAI